ncbi:MAG TPA: UrcA family protein [Myxococcota bacterium]
MKKLALTLSFALATAAFAAPMLANGGEARSVSVLTSDLNLASDAGVQALYARIRHAGQSVCKQAEGRSVSATLRHKECVRTAIDGAVRSAKNDALTSLHMARTGVSSATVAAK